MRILYECDHAGSPTYGMAHRMYQFAEEFVEQGHEVMIVGASFSHMRRVNPQTKGRITAERQEGAEYRWIKTPKYRGNGVKRVLHMLLYSLRLWLYAKRLAREFQPEAIICGGVTPFDFFGCYRMARASKARLLFEVRDLWPLTPIELGGYSPKHPFIRMLAYAEKYAYTHTDAVVSALPDTQEYMKTRGLGEKPFYYIPNGIKEKLWELPPRREDLVAQLPAEHLEIIDSLRAQGKLLVGYTGTLNLSNSVDIIVAAAIELEERGVELILVGSGPLREKLNEMVHDADASNVHFLGQQPKKNIPLYLSCMDFLYVGFTRHSLYRFGVSPNKIFDYMASGKPIVQAIEASNNLVQLGQCGVNAEPESVESVKTAILELAMLPKEQREKMGENGRDYVFEHHAYSKLAEKYLKALKRKD